MFVRFMKMYVYVEPFFENLWFVLQVLKNVEFMLGRSLRMYGLYIGPFFENV